MSQEPGENKKKMARVVAKAWADESYKKRLLAEPAAVLGEEGIEIPDGVTVQVIEDTPTRRTFVLPPPIEGPDHVEEIEERIAAAVGIPS